MNTAVTPRRIRPGPTRRHEARVQRFSRDAELLSRLDGLSVSDAQVPDIVLEVCSSLGVEAPKLKFHAQRSPYTGATEQPRWLLVDTHGQGHIEELERGMRTPFAPFGAIRLGRTTTLMTVAHEVGHHLVFALDPPSTPAHGRVWVGRFDDAALRIALILDQELASHPIPIRT